MIQRRRSKASGIKIAIAACMGIIAVLLGYLLYQRVQESKESNRVNDILVMATQPANTEIAMDGPEFAQIIELANNADTEGKRINAMRALAAADPTDSSDFDATATEYVTKTMEILPEVRASFIRNVLAKRMNPAMVEPLIEFARSTNDYGSAVAAMEAIRPEAGNGQFETLLGVVQFHPNANFKAAAAETAAAIVGRSGNRGELVKAIDSALKETSDSETKEMLKKIKAGE
jgi:hypothetical protein